jgi:hypothetical protein
MLSYPTSNPLFIKSLNEPPIQALCVQKIMCKTTSDSDYVFHTQSECKTTSDSDYVFHTQSECKTTSDSDYVFHTQSESLRSVFSSNKVCNTYLREHCTCPFQESAAGEKIISVLDCLF